jgi:hypothetical protein
MCFVSGHGFSRAEEIPKMKWALAPAAKLTIIVNTTVLRVDA